MKPSQKIESIVKRMSFAAGPEMDGRLRADIERTRERPRAQAILADWFPRGFFTPCPIPQFAFAGAPLSPVVFGLSGFSRSDARSDVVRKEVDEKAQPGRGVILRIREMASEPNNVDYAIKRFSPTRSRTDDYKDEQIVHTFYTDLESMTHTFVVHAHKHYLSEQIAGQEAGFLGRNKDWLNPAYLREAIRSAEHRELGSKTIDGVVCEGMETTDPAALGPLPGPVTRLDVEMRLWVDAETQYPVRFEAKMDCEAEGKRMTSECVMDQFQWDVELDPSIFEPNLTDYEDMRNL